MHETPMDSLPITNSIAALRTSIRALESRADSLEIWLHIWVTFVAIGVIVEVAFVFWDYREDLEEYRRGTIRSPRRPSKWNLLLELLCAGLVAIGVAGELGVDIETGGIQTDLRTKNGELVQLLQGTSSLALGNAADANERASQNAKEAARLNKLAEDERTARVNIEARVAWRRLTSKQKADIGNALGSRFAGQGVSFWYSAGDTESSWFAADLAEAVQGAHTLRVYPPPREFHDDGGKRSARRPNSALRVRC
jgi:hypothetical protein